MLSKVEFLVATGRRVALRGWSFDIELTGCLNNILYSFVDLLRGENKLMFVNMCNLDRIFFFFFVSRG